MIRRARRAVATARSLMRDSERLLQTYCMVVLATFAMGFMLIELKPLLLPLCFATFLSLLYIPLIDLLTCRSQRSCRNRNSSCRTAAKRRASIIGDDGNVSQNCWNTFVDFAVDMFSIGKMPKAFAIPFAIITAFGVLGLAGWVVYDAADELYERKDEYAERFDTIVGNLAEWATSVGVNITRRELKHDIEEMLIENVAVGAAEGVASFLVQTLLMLVFLVFILFMRSSAPPVSPVDLENNPWAAVKFKSAEKVQRYIIVKTIISLCTGTLVGFMLGLLGAPMPTVFGMLAFIFNFVPSIGSWIATFLPVPVILFDPDQTLTTALLAILLPGAAQVIIGDFIEPHFLGKLCQVSPLVVLVSLMLFGYLWGIAGMVLALPITIVIKLICKQIPHPIPRYIAGMIYGDLFKYKRRLDRQIASLHSRKRRASLTGYHTDESDDDNDDVGPSLDGDLGAHVTTDAQLSHIVLHDDDDSDDGTVRQQRANHGALSDTMDTDGGRFSEDLERAHHLARASRGPVTGQVSSSPTRRRVELPPLRVSSANDLTRFRQNGHSPYGYPGSARRTRRRRGRPGRTRSSEQHSMRNRRHSGDAAIPHRSAPRDLMSQTWDYATSATPPRSRSADMPALRGARQSAAGFNGVTSTPDAVHVQVMMNNRHADEPMSPQGPPTADSRRDMEVPATTNEGAGTAAAGALDIAPPSPISVDSGMADGAFNGFHSDPSPFTRHTPPPE